MDFFSSEKHGFKIKLFLNLDFVKIVHVFFDHKFLCLELNKYFNHCINDFMIYLCQKIILILHDSRKICYLSVLSNCKNITYFFQKKKFTYVLHEFYINLAKLCKIHVKFKNFTKSTKKQQKKNVKFYMEASMQI